MSPRANLTDEEVVLEAARTIRPFLDDLLAPDAAAETDGALAALLAAAGDREPVHEEILRCFRAAPATRRWWLDFVGSGLPPEVRLAAAPTRADIPGRGEIVPPPRYVCPVNGDYVWYRLSAIRPVPLCRTHNVRLQAAPEDA